MRNIVVGLGFGDEGKGTIVDSLTQKNNSKTVVRFSGGPQAAHNVMTDAGLHHTFAQFGSGTFNGCNTLLSQYMIVDPSAFLNEANHLKDLGFQNILDRIQISENAKLVTPIHVAINQERETLRGDSRHGSTGLGIGETTLFSILRPKSTLYVKDMFSSSILKEKIQELANYALEQVNLAISSEILQNIYEQYLEYGKLLQSNIVSDDVILEKIAKDENAVFEGSQGILLDEDYGFHPHTTWSTVTPHYAEKLLEDASITEFQSIGVFRSYMTRHGAGPMFQEESTSVDFIQNHPEVHNEYGLWQGNWRRGLLDLPLLEYSVQHAQIDSLAITHLDHQVEPIIWHHKAEFYDLLEEISNSKYNKDQQGKYVQKLIELKPADVLLQPDSVRSLKTAISAKLDLPISIESYGPYTRDKVFNNS